MRQEDRLNMAQFGWANGMRNMVFVAGRLLRNARNPLLFSLQQTPIVAQSIPVMTGRFPLSDSFPDGTYVSVFARLRGRTVVGEDGAALDSGVALQALHTRFVNALEVDPDVAQARLMRACHKAPADATLDTQIRAMDVQTPDELKEFINEPRAETPLAEAVEADPYALLTKDTRLLRNGNHAQIAGVIGFMEYRDGGIDSSSARVQLYIQQASSLEDAMLVRVYGKQAVIVATNYRPGHAVYVSGEIQLDVKRQPESGALKITPYLKTYSVESAQTPHIKISPYPDWALKLYEEGNTNLGFAKRSRLTKAEPTGGKETPADTSAQPK